MEPTPEQLRLLARCAIRIDGKSSTSPTSTTSSPSPTYWRDPPVPDQRIVAHTELVLAAAAKEDLLRLWPFDDRDPRLIIQSGPTPPSAGGSWWAK